MAKMSRSNKLILCQLAVAFVIIIYRIHSTKFLLDNVHDIPATYKENREEASNQIANQTNVSLVESPSSLQLSSSSTTSPDEKLAVGINNEESNDSQSENNMNTTFIETSSSKGIASINSEDQSSTSDQLPTQNKTSSKDVDEITSMKLNGTETVEDETHPDESNITSSSQHEESLNLNQEKQLNQSYQRPKKPILAVHW